MDQFKINEEFARKFEHNARRKEMDRLQQKYGKADENDQDESSEEEDSEGELLTQNVEIKFANLLKQIKTNPESLKEIKGEYFQESDFEDDHQKEKSQKKITYKDVLRKDIQRKMKNDSDGEQDSDQSEQKNEFFKKDNKKGETLAEEQERIKKEFLQKIKEKGDDSDDDFLIKKDKSPILDKPENSVKKQKKEMVLETDKDILQNLYGQVLADQSSGKRVDKQDKFLLDFIINERWKGKNKNNQESSSEEDHYKEYQIKNEEKVDDEDSDRDLEMDVFEQKHNFRFEEKGAQLLTTYGRSVPEDSLRRVDEKRKLQRQDAKAKKEEEKQKKKEEIERLRALKRQEIVDKLKKADFLAGNVRDKTGLLTERKLLERAEKELNTEFIPDLYDKTMDAIFDENYYKTKDQQEGLEDNKDIDLLLMGDKINQIGKDSDSDAPLVDSDDIYEVQQLSDADEADRKLIELTIAKKQKKFEDTVYKSVQNQVDQNQKDQGYQTWYTCDECHHPIQALHFRFDCGTCDNFTLCEKCFKNNTKHTHKFKKVRVPKDHIPPPNADDLIAISYMLCCGCRDSLIDMTKRVYICRICSPDIDESGEGIYWCKDCKDKEPVHNHKLEKFKGIPGLVDGDSKNETKGAQYLDKVLQEYYDLDCEDVIAGGELKTRFKYTSVPKENFGLTEEEILLLDDNDLNKFVSMKKLRPYRQVDENGQALPDEKKKDHKVNEFKIRKLKNELKETLNMRRQLVRENQVTQLELDKEELLGKKDTNYKELSKAERKKLKQEKRNKKAKYTISSKDKKRKSEDIPKEENIENMDKKRRRLHQQYQIKS